MPLGTAAGLSVAWSIWAFALLAAGFGVNVRSARIWGYIILAVTLSKVFASDLSYLDIQVRASLLFVMGLVMLVSGYIAIRSKSASEPVTDEPFTSTRSSAAAGDQRLAGSRASGLPEMRITQRRKVREGLL